MRCVADAALPIRIHLLQLCTDRGDVAPNCAGVVIVRACGRSSKHQTLNLARLCLNLARRDYWMPRLKRHNYREFDD
jgi:hypothetical protein